MACHYPQVVCEMVLTEVSMFEVWCPSHESRVLLPASRIVALRNTPVGPVLHWRCWCGTTGRLVRGRSPVPVDAVETVETSRTSGAA